MSKSSKKNGRVPKITEAEYAEYISALKGEEPNRAVSSENEQTTERKEPKM